MAETETIDVLSWIDDEFPPSYFIQMDTGWREIDGERVAGWHVEIYGPGKRGEGHSHSLREALTTALTQAQLLPAPAGR